MRAGANDNAGCAWLLVPALLLCPETVEVIAHGGQTVEAVPTCRLF